MKLRVIGIVTVMAGMCSVVVFSLWRSSNRVPQTYLYDVEDYRAQERTAMGRFVQTARYPLSMREPRTVAVGPGGQCVVTGDRTVLVLDASGAETQRIRLDNEPRCVAVDGADLYVALADRIEVYDSNGARQAAWESLGEQAYLTGLAVLNGEVFATDYGQRVVWRFDSTGRLLGRIARPSAADGFVLPSPTFDLAAGDDCIWVSNSGRGRVEQYSPDGKRGRVWGHASMEIDGFCGCCNPTHLAVMPDGRFVTSEKGLPRVKVFHSDGTFEGLVAGSEQLGPNAGALDVAVDAAGRILVLDTADRSLRVFEESVGM